MWIVDSIVHFGPGDLVKNGYSHFGFYDRNGDHYAIFHQKHILGLIGENDQLEWTLAAKPILKGIPNIVANLSYPMFVDNLADNTLLVSNFGDACIFRVDVEKRKAELFIEGSKLGMTDAGNCVVDDEGFVWVNEVKGCRIWRFDDKGVPLLMLGHGEPVFQLGSVGFGEAGFSWVYDIRRGHDGNIYVLDSRNFAVRMIDVKRCVVSTLAGTGKPGYDGDGGDALHATFGSDPSAKFDGPLSLSLDEEGNVFVGDRMNHVVRMIEKESGKIHTIAGNTKSVKGLQNDSNEKNPMNLNLPEISSMEYHDGKLLIPTDISSETGDLAIIRKRD